MQAVTILRDFLKSNPLPSEGQQIDRIMTDLANKNVSAIKPSEFPEGADSLSVFFFSLLMLNTDLHNSKIEVKMTPDQFVRNLAGQVNVPEKQLRFVYDDIKETPLVRV